MPGLNEVHEERGLYFSKIFLLLEITFLRFFWGYYAVNFEVKSELFIQAEVFVA